MIDSPLWWQEKQARFSTKVAAERWSNGSARSTAARAGSPAAAARGSAATARNTTVSNGATAERRSTGERAPDWHRSREKSSPASRTNTLAQL
jgi:hypothetical protein